MLQMRMWVAVVVVVALGFGWVSAQQRVGRSGALTGQDYEEIKTLYARYNQGSDFRDADLFVSAFSEDAVLTRAGGSVEGMAALRAERAERYQGQTGDVGRRHLNGSYLITSTSDGAKGRAYYLLIDVTSSPPTMTASGYYEDEFVRTPAGWRIKHRTLHSDATGQ